METSCRACMSQLDSNKMIFMFESAYKVAEIFSKCVSLDVSITGVQMRKLPQAFQFHFFLCAVLHECYDITLLSRVSDKILMNLGLRTTIQCVLLTDTRIGRSSSKYLLYVPRNADWI